MAGLWVDEFMIGQRFVHEVRRTVTDMDNMFLSSPTCNPVPIHIDRHDAATIDHGRPEPA